MSLAETNYVSKAEREKFYKSLVWEQIKSNVFSRDVFLCRICETNLAKQCHHLTYARFGGAELPKDLISICIGCHEKIHDGCDELKEKELVEKDFNEHLAEAEEAWELVGRFCNCDGCQAFRKKHKGLNLRFRCS